MRRGLVPVVVLAFLLLPFALQAQHGGHGGSSGTGKGSTGSSGVSADNPDLTDFKHAVQVQANEYQIAEYQTVSKNTSDALEKAHALAQSGSGADSIGVMHQATALNDAVDEARAGNTRFVGMLTDNQTAGLKKLLKELSKTQLAVSKQEKIFEQEIDGSKDDPKGIVVEAAKLEKALTAYQTSQVNVARDMGILKR